MTFRERPLAATSAAQLMCGVAGLVIAVRRGHAYDLPKLHGRTDRVARDALVIGTALSPPTWMLVAQAVLTLRLADRENTRAARGLAGLGAAMIAGYLGERLVRIRLHPTGWEALESPLIVAGLALASAMAVLGLRTP